MIGFFEVAESEKSMGRLLAFMAMTVGILLACAGVISAFCGVDLAAVMMTTGAGLCGSGQVLKGWQKHHETRGATNE